MSFAVQVQQFNGPLHVLLELIEKDQMDISTIALAAVTESYLKYLDENPGIPLEELADFLIVASKLLFIKSKAILPIVVQNEEDDVQDLETQLKIYREYLEASGVVIGMLNAKRVMYVHDKLPSVAMGFVPPPVTFTMDVMHGMFDAVIKKLTPVVRLPKAAYEKAVSIQEKIRHIQALLKKGAQVHFRNVLEQAQNKTEIIVSFLALLELVKQRDVMVSQDSSFHDILIEKV